MKKSIAPTSIDCSAGPLPTGDSDRCKQDTQSWLDLIKLAKLPDGSAFGEILGTHKIYIGKDDLKRIVCEIDSDKEIVGVLIAIGCTVVGKKARSTTLAKRKMVPYVSSAKLNKGVKEVKLFELKTLRTFPEAKK